MLTKKQEAALEEVERFNEIRDSRTCEGCGKDKNAGYPLCLRCLLKLPADLRHRLYQPVGEDFFAANAQAAAIIKGLRHVN